MRTLNKGLRLKQRVNGMEGMSRKGQGIGGFKTPDVLLLSGMTRTRIWQLKRGNEIMELQRPKYRPEGCQRADSSHLRAGMAQV